MRFVIVNLQHQKGDPYFCAFCTADIGSQYLRELDTGLIYCDTECLKFHTYGAIKYLEDQRSIK